MKGFISSHFYKPLVALIDEAVTNLLYEMNLPLFKTKPQDRFIAQKQHRVLVPPSIGVPSFFQPLRLSLPPSTPLLPALFPLLSLEGPLQTTGNDASSLSSLRVSQEVTHIFDGHPLAVNSGNPHKSNEPKLSMFNLFLKRMSSPWRRSKSRAGISPSRTCHEVNEPITRQTSALRTIKRWLVSFGLRTLHPTAKLDSAAIQDNILADTMAFSGANAPYTLNPPAEVNDLVLSLNDIPSFQQLNDAPPRPILFVSEHVIPESHTHLTHNISSDSYPSGSAAAPNLNNPPCTGPLPCGLLFSPESPSIVASGESCTVPETPSPFDTLQAELIHEIFLNCVYGELLGEDRHYRLRQKEAPFVLSCVCKKWRRLMSQSAFKIVDVSFGSMHDRFIDCIPDLRDGERLDQLSLEICDTISNDLNGCPSGWTYLQRTPAIARQLARALGLVPHARAIRIVLPNYNSSDYMQEFGTHRWTLPQLLTTLRADPAQLEKFSWKWNIPMGTLFPQQFPPMNTNRHLSFAWNKLKYLSLECEITMYDLLVAIRDCGSQLVRLSVSRITPNLDNAINPDLPGGTLKNLESLKIKSSTPLAPLFSSRNVAQNLKRLDATLTTEHSNADLHELPIRWTTLEKLSLNCQVAIDRLTDILADSESLVDLQLHGQSMPSSFGFEILNFPAQPLAFRRLQDLTVSSEDMRIQKLVDGVLNGLQGSDQILKAISLSFAPRALMAGELTLLERIQLTCPLPLNILGAVLINSANLIHGDFALNVPNFDIERIEKLPVIFLDSLQSLLLRPYGFPAGSEEVIEKFLPSAIFAKTTVLY